MANVGKSTLANALVETDVCLTSKRPHTTLHNVYAYFNDGNKQVALVDTPGIIRSLDGRLVDHTMKLEPRLQRDPGSTCRCAFVTVLLSSQNDLLLALVLSCA